MQVEKFENEIKNLKDTLKVNKDSIENWTKLYLIEKNKCKDLKKELQNSMNSLNEMKPKITIMSETISSAQT